MMNHIELFAGCGGLCLGLTSCGFRLTMANELSPMASETFAYNFFNENLAVDPGFMGRAVWLSSAYPRNDMTKRLREDPRTYPAGQNSDMLPGGENLEGALVVGNILELNQWLEDHPAALQKLRDGFGAGGVDLVSGGPPCQSFSLAGLREKNNAKNSLPWAFARFADLIRPKIVLLENVSGILRPFTENGQKYHAWFEVAKAFAAIGYVPLTLHVNAKYAGVAQNRPRFILIGLRENVFEALRPGFNAAESELFRKPAAFYGKVRAGQAVTLDDTAVHDLNKEEPQTVSLYRDSFLAPLAVRMSRFVSVAEAIGDLGQAGGRKSSYVAGINRDFGKLLPRRPGDDFSHRLIDNQDRVKRRFRIYQAVARTGDNAVKTDVAAVLSGKRSGVSDATWQALRGSAFLQHDGTMEPFHDRAELDAYLREHLTRKQTQRALIADEPAPAALSIPDDACHYDELRTLTAREMARIQSFPDNFIFRSKMTTGGQCRAFEVPIYTQIGNAVPVLLGRALGLCVKSLLDRLKIEP